MSGRRIAVVVRGVSHREAARQLGLQTDEFLVALPDLLRRGFPEADPTTKLFDPIAIDRWCDARYPHLNSTRVVPSVDPVAVMRERLARARNG
jgi:hypothetical protein